MKTIIAFADSHNNPQGINKLIPIMNEADYIISLGDTINDHKLLYNLYQDKYIAIRGNCDYDYTLPIDKIIRIEQINLYLTHGHYYRVKYGLNHLLQKAKEIKANAVLYGHTHISDITEEKGIKFINPGTMSKRNELSYAYIVINKAQLLVRNVFI